MADIVQVSAGRWVIDTNEIPTWTQLYNHESTAESMSVVDEWNRTTPKTN